MRVRDRRARTGGGVRALALGPLAAPLVTRSAPRGTPHIPTRPRTPAAADQSLPAPPPPPPPPPHPTPQPPRNAAGGRPAPEGSRRAGRRGPAGRGAARAR